MDFPIADLMDEPACYAQLVDWLHPDGMTCPRCHQHDRMVVHRRGRDPVLDFRCGHCHRVFNAFTGTALHGISAGRPGARLATRPTPTGTPKDPPRRRVTASLAHQNRGSGPGWRTPVRRVSRLPGAVGRSGFAAGWGERAGWVVRTGV